MRQVGRNNSYSIEEIKEYLIENDMGISLISTEYKNAHTKLEFKCNHCEFEFSKLFKDIQTRGIGCSVCEKHGERLNKEDIKSKVEKYDYEILEFIRGDSRRGWIFKAKCFRNHIIETTIKELTRLEEKRGGVCKECVAEGFHRDRRKCMKEYNGNIEEWGYTYQGEILTHSTDRRDFICKNGHKRNITYSALKIQPDCPECRGFIYKHTEQTVSKYLKDINMIYIGGYTDKDTPFDFICHCGAKTQGLLNELMRAGNCKLCSRKTIYTIEMVNNIFKENNCVLLEKEYKNTRIPLPFICSCGKLAEKPLGEFVDHPSCKECCRYKNRKRGENHPCWNPLLTDEERLKSRKYPEYKEWRLSVYERDNYTCQCCFDNSGGNLEAHHVLNHADHYELRLDIDNGVTLCSICHQDFHMTYGFTDNNREQLNEFLEEFHSELINSI